jgi:hypothetical protein
MKGEERGVRSEERGEIEGWSEGEKERRREGKVGKCFGGGGRKG